MNDELLIKFLLNEATAEEVNQIQKWIAENSENQRYYAQFERIWNESAALTKSSPVNEEVAWQKFMQRVNGAKSLSTPVKKLTVPAIWLRIAAVFMFCFGAWLFYQQFDSKITEITSNDLVLNQTLPDGSKLVLNKNTHISYAKNFKTNRELAINSGEVFFDVVPDRSHPFAIAVADVKVEVVGTSFNIKKTKNAVEVIVESGTVKVANHQQQLTLKKGESVLLTGREKILVKNKTTDELHSYYRTKLFVTNNTPLPKLIAVLSDAYDNDIVLNDNAQQLRISTTLPLKYTLVQNLNTICETLDLKMQRNQSQILLSKK